MQNTKIDTLNSSIEANEYNAPIAIFHTKLNDNFEINYANSTFYEEIGYNKEEVANLFSNSLLSMLEESSKEKLICALNTQKKQYTFTVNIICKDSVVKTFIIQGAILQNVNEEFTQNYLVDISKQTQIIDTLSSINKYSELFSSFTDDTYIDFDIHAKTLNLSPNFAKKYSIEQSVLDYPKALIDKGIIKEDILKIDEILMPYLPNLAKAVLENSCINSSNIMSKNIEDINIVDVKEHYASLFTPDGKQTNHIVYLKILLDSSNVPLRIIGKIYDITKQQAQIDQLKIKAEKDLLTGLYNKVTSENLASNLFINGNPMHDQYILMIIDVDNFKKVNDIHGHLFGDILLAQLSDHLKDIFRSEDIIGRLGGDEFIVVMKNFSTYSFLHRKARNICTAFNKTFEHDTQKIEISSSIGIAYYPMHGTDFTTLYKNADKALYSAKAKGKNNYVIYNQDTIHPTYLPNRTEIDDSGMAQKSFKENKFEYIFKLLYSTEDLNTTLQAILKIITDDFGFTRAYIIEPNKDFTSFSKTYEYNSYPDEIYTQNWQDISFANFSEVYKVLLMYERLIFRTIEEAPLEFQAIMHQNKVKSTMIFHVRDKDKPACAIGFDNTKKMSSMTEVEVNELATLSELIGTFIVKESLTKS